MKSVARFDLMIVFDDHFHISNPKTARVTATGSSLHLRNGLSRVIKLQVSKLASEMMIKHGNIDYV